MVTSTRRLRKSLIAASFVLTAALAVYAQTGRGGTLKRPIIDSRMTEKEAFDGLDPKCPEEIRKRQRLIAVKYYSTDGRVHQGQLVIDADLVSDVKKVFAL